MYHVSDVIKAEMFLSSDIKSLLNDFLFRMCKNENVRLGKLNIVYNKGFSGKSTTEMCRLTFLERCLWKKNRTDWRDEKDKVILDEKTMHRFLSGWQVQSMRK